MRVLVRREIATVVTITPAAVCRCALRVKTASGQIQAAWDATKRLRNKTIATEFILGADNAFNDVRNDCALAGIGNLKERLAAASEANTREDYDEAAARLLGLNAALNDLLLDCMGPSVKDNTSQLA